MLDYLKENKSYITISIIILFSFIFISFVFFDKDNDETIYFEVQNVKKEMSTNNEEIFRRPSLINDNSNNSKKQNKEESIIESLVLYSITSEEGKYSISFKSDKTPDSEQDIVKYVSLSGNIVEDSKTELFSLPLNESYIYILNNIRIEIINNETKKISSCAGNFLNTVLPEFSYYIQIDISNDSTHCYIKSQSEPKSSINHPLKDLKSDENLSINIDEKELKEFKTLDKDNLNNNDAKTSSN